MCTFFMRRAPDVTHFDTTKVSRRTPSPDTLVFAAIVKRTGLDPPPSETLCTAISRRLSHSLALSSNAVQQNGIQHTTQHNTTQHNTPRLHLLSKQSTTTSTHHTLANQPCTEGVWCASNNRPSPTSSYTKSSTSAEDSLSSSSHSTLTEGVASASTNTGTGDDSALNH